MSIEVIKYKEEYWQELQDFIHKEWKQDHPITNKALFDWQYKGYGCDHNPSKLLLINNKIHGFIGNIPVIYQVPGYDKPLNSVSIAIWIVSKQYQQTGVGLLLFNKTLEEFDFCMAVGLNLKVVPIYKKMKFGYTYAYKRYVLPLEVEGYSNILKFSTPLHEVQQWYDSINFCDLERLPSEMNAVECEALWQKYNNKSYLTLFRNQEFWTWRYKKNVGFKYLYFKPDNFEGFIVGKIERIISDNPKLSNKKVFRIIELVSDLENDKYHKAIIDNLLMPVVCWAKNNGCIAVDFQCSSDYYKQIFIKAGFLEHDKDFKPDIASLSPLFQPYRPEVPPISMAWRAVKDGEVLPISLEQTLMLKSDADMDRPNILKEGNIDV